MGRVMLRSCCFIVAATILVSQMAEAQQPTTLTLACNGTMSGHYDRGTASAEEEKPEPISMGININFTARTVEGFSAPPPAPTL